MRTLPAAVATLLMLFAGGAAARTVDLVTYSPPTGWNVEDKPAGFAVMSRIFGTSWCQAALHRGTPASGDLNASFAAEWKAVALQSIDPVDAPAPATRKVGNTTAAVGSAASSAGGQPAYAKLIVLDGGASVASLLVMSSSKKAMKTCDADLEPMLGGLVVKRTATPAAPVAAAETAPAKAAVSGPLPTKVAALAGEWALTDGINITYVDRYTGSYAGTDSLHFREKWIITAAGGISLDFFGIQNGKKISENNSGTIAIENGIVIIRMSNTQRYVLRGWYDGPSATVLVMNGPWYEAPIPADVLSNPEQGSNLDKKWLRKK